MIATPVAQKKGAVEQHPGGSVDKSQNRFIR
jgi:hypothetical protein